MITYQSIDELAPIYKISGYISPAIIYLFLGKPIKFTKIEDEKYDWSYSGSRQHRKFKCGELDDILTSLLRFSTIYQFCHKVEDVRELDRSRNFILISKVSLISDIENLKYFERFLKESVIVREQDLSEYKDFMGDAPIIQDLSEYQDFKEDIKVEISALQKSFQNLRITTPSRKMRHESNQ